MTIWICLITGEECDSDKCEHPERTMINDPLDDVYECAHVYEEATSAEIQCKERLMGA
jgi:hypothetical protein